MTPKRKPTKEWLSLAGGDANQCDPTGSASLPQSAPEGKPFATLRAKLALKGHWLQCLPDGSYLVGAWHYSRALADLDAVRDFLRVVGGQP